MFTAQDFQLRRTNLINLIPESSAIAIIYGRERLYRSPTIPIEFDQYSDLIYFTGHTKPSGALVMTKDGNKSQSIFFLPEKDPAIDQFDGLMPSFEEAQKTSGVDKVLPMSELRDFILRNTQGRQTYCSFPTHQSAHSPFKQLSFLTDKLRVVKSPKEIEIIKKACAITTKSLPIALSHAAPGVLEGELEHIFLLENAKQGTNKVSYPSVVASGPNAISLHYLDNNRRIQDDDVIMMDAGAQYENYASDYTRCVAVGNAPQLHKDVLEMVNYVKDFLVVNAKAMKFQTLEHIHVMSEQLLIKGLKELGLNVSQTSLRSLYPQGVSHWIGLDVHDADSISYSYKLQKGNVFSIEPGLVFNPTNPIVPKEFAGLGCRFEDTVILE